MYRERSWFDIENSFETLERPVRKDWMAWIINFVCVAVVLFAVGRFAVSYFFGV